MLDLSEDRVLMKDMIYLFEFHNIELLEYFECEVTAILLGLSKTNSPKGA